MQTQQQIQADDVMVGDFYKATVIAIELLINTYLLVLIWNGLHFQTAQVLGFVALVLPFTAWSIHHREELGDIFDELFDSPDEDENDDS